MKRTSAKKVGMNEAAVSRVQNFGSDAKVESSKKGVNKKQFWPSLFALLQCFILHSFWATLKLRFAKHKVQARACGLARNFVYVSRPSPFGIIINSSREMINQI